MSISVYTPEDTKILHTAYADFVSRQIGRPVHMVQYDDSLPVLAVKLFSDGQVYTIPRNADVNIRWNKPDGTYIYNPALGCGEDRHIVYFEITPQMAAYAGESSPVVEIDYEGSVAASSPIGIMIDKNPVPDDEIVSSNEYKSIAKYASEAVNAAASASASRSAAEISENNAKGSEVNAKQSADSAIESKDASAVSKSKAESAAERAEAAALAASNAADEAVSKTWAYGECNEAMGVQAKTVSIKDFALAKGAKVTVKFLKGNSAANPTLNVSGTGAKEIYYSGAPVSKNYIKRESVHEFVYDGVHWLLEGEKGAGYYHVTCTTESDVAAKSVVLAGFRLVNGAQLTLQFTNGNTAENPTLNVQNTGAYPIYYGGMPVPSGYITANSAVPLIFDGQNHWVVVGDFLQRQLDELKRFVHYTETIERWDEISIVQENGYIYEDLDTGIRDQHFVVKKESNIANAKSTSVILAPGDCIRIKANWNDTRISKDAYLWVASTSISHPEGNFTYAYMTNESSISDNVYIYTNNYGSTTTIILMINSYYSSSDIEIHKHVLETKKW